MSIEVQGQQGRFVSAYLWNLLTSRWRVVREKRRIRREYRELMRADERILKDLGLTRMQIEFERRQHDRRGR